MCWPPFLVVRLTRIFCLAGVPSHSLGACEENAKRHFKTRVTKIIQELVHVHVMVNWDLVLKMRNKPAVYLFGPCGILSLAETEN